MQDVKGPILERLEMLRLLGEDHGGEGEKAPNQRSFDYAVDAVAMHYVGRPFTTTLDDHGNAVFEFNKPPSTFADVTFLDDGSVSCYKRVADKDSEQFVVPCSSDKFTLFFQQLVG